MTKRALVTGSSGAVGRHFVPYLDKLGWDIHLVDIVDGYDCRDVFRESDTVYDLVIHLAARIGGRAGIDGVNDYYPYDQEIDAAAIGWAIRTRQKHFLAFSSSAAYPIHLQSKHSHSRLHEIDVNLSHPFPDANYGMTKVSLERMVAVARANGINCTVVRPFSGYGTDQSTDYPFTAILNRVIAGDLTVWGPPGQTRDWVHLDDVVRAAYTIAMDGTEAPVNICTGRPTEMGELALLMEELHGDENFIPVRYDETKPTGVFYRVGDPRRMHEFYGPTISLEEGIDRALRERSG